MTRRILKQTALFSSALLLAISFMMLIGPSSVSAASADATHYCLHKSPQGVCEQAYDAQKGGQSVQQACGSYADGSDAKDTCQSAWGKAAGEDPAVYCSASTCDFVAKYVNPAINLFTLIFGLIATASIILGGIQYSASEGDPQKSAAAKNRITNTIIAIFAYIFLYAFLQFLVPGGTFRG